MTTRETKSCFIVGPIGEPGSDVRNHSDWFFEEIIIPTLRSIDRFQSPIRSDKISEPGLIDAQVIRHLLDDDLVVADLSFLNANAFYEIGIRHMIEKPIIHMQLASDRTPFDVSLYRSIKFSLKRPEDLRNSRKELTSAIEMVLSEEYKVENPVTNARGQIRIRENATPESKVLIDQISALQQRVARLERGGSAQSMHEMLSIKIVHDPSVDIHSGLISVAPKRLMSASTRGGTTYVTLRMVDMPFEEFEKILDDIKAIPGVIRHEILSSSTAVE